MVRDADKADVSATPDDHRAPVLDVRDLLD